MKPDHNFSDTRLQPLCKQIDYQTFNRRSHPVLFMKQLPKGIMRSAVPLPCFFDVVRSPRIAGLQPQQGTKSCRTGRNSISLSTLSVCLPILLSISCTSKRSKGQLMGSEGQLVGSEGLPGGSEGLPNGSEGLLKGSDGLPKEPEDLPEGSEGLAKGSEGLPKGSEGLP